MILLKRAVVLLVVLGIFEAKAASTYKDCNCGSICTQALICLKDTVTGKEITYGNGCGLCHLNCGQPGRYARCDDPFPKLGIKPAVRPIRVKPSQEIELNHKYKK